MSCYIISNHPGMVELTGHDDIDNARLMQNFGFGPRSVYSSNEGWGSNYGQAPSDSAHEENPYELETMSAKSTFPPINNESTPKDGVDVSNAEGNENVDAYLNPFAAENTF